MTLKYEPTFGKLAFTGPHKLLKESEQGCIVGVLPLLEREIDENLMYDHWHPEIAGPLQQAHYFLEWLLRETRKREEQHD